MEQRIILLTFAWLPFGSAKPGIRSTHAEMLDPLAALVVPAGHVTATALAV